MGSVGPLSVNPSAQKDDFLELCSAVGDNRIKMFAFPQLLKAWIIEVLFGNLIAGDKEFAVFIADNNDKG